MGKESFIIYKSFYEPLKMLTDEQLGRLFRAIFEYQINNKEEVEDDIKMAFEFFKNQFRIDEKKYNVIVERNKRNGAKGGRPLKNKDKNPKNPVGFQKSETNPKNPMGPKKPDNENDNENENDNVNVNVTNNNINNKECEYVTQKGIKCSKQAKLRVDGKYYCGQHSRIELQKYGFNIEINKDNNKIYFVNEEINKLFMDFLELRKSMKIKNTDRAIMLLINKLEKYPDEIKKQMIEESIEKSWRSVYPPKNYKSEEKLPQWFNKDNEVEVVTEEQQKEMEDLFSKWKE